METLRNVKYNARARERARRCCNHVQMHGIVPCHWGYLAMVMGAWVAVRFRLSVITIGWAIGYKEGLDALM